MRFLPRRRRGLCLKLRNLNKQSRPVILEGGLQRAFLRGECAFPEVPPPEREFRLQKALRTRSVPESRWRKARGLKRHFRAGRRQLRFPRCCFRFPRWHLPGLRRHWHPQGLRRHCPPPAPIRSETHSYNLSRSSHRSFIRQSKNLCALKILPASF